MSSFSLVLILLKYLWISTSNGEYVWTGSEWKEAEEQDLINSRRGRIIEDQDPIAVRTGSGSEWEDGEENEDLCPSGWSLDESREMCYLFVNDKKTWSDGQDHCKSITDDEGSLASSTSSETNDLLFFWSAKHSGGYHIFIAGKRVDKSDKFKWYDNINTSWSNTWDHWSKARGEPNDEYDCVALGYQNGEWRTVDCSIPSPFLCQQSLNQDPVNCSLSKWSPWSSCRNCEGQGCMIKTRNVTGKQKFGGSCDQELYQIKCEECQSQAAEIIGVSFMISLIGIIIASLVSIHFTKRKYINTIVKLKAARSLYEMKTFEKQDAGQRYDNYDNDDLCDDMEETTFVAIDATEIQYPGPSFEIDVSELREPCNSVAVDVSTHQENFKEEKNDFMPNSSGVYYSSETVYYD